MQICVFLYEKYESERSGNDEGIQNNSSVGMCLLD